jgi:hypothetical protein
MSGAQVHLQAKSPFTEDPQYTLFSAQYEERDVYVAESFELPFDNQNPRFNTTAMCTIPAKADLIRRITVRSKLPELYTPLGPGFVYPKYSDQVDGSIYNSSGTLVIQPGDFVGYFNTQYLNFWASNFVGYSVIYVTYDSTLNKFIFTSPTYSSIYFQNENSASFWGFDIRTFDFITPGGYYGYNFSNGTLVAPLSLVQAGWIRGFTPPPPTGFSYKDSVACRLIKEARLLIGGQTIDKLTSDRLIIEDDLGVSYENQPALTVLEGKNDTSGVYTPREYYTRLTFNTDCINMSELYRQDVQIQVDFEKFENLPATLINTNSIVDSNSYTNSQWATLSDANVMPEGRVYATFGWKQYVVRMNVLGGLNTMEWIFYDTTKNLNSASSWYKWTDPYDGYGYTPLINRAFVIDGNIYFGWGYRIYKRNLTNILNNTEGSTPEIGPILLDRYGSGGDGTIIPGAPYGAFGGITADARYLYIDQGVNMFTFNSNSASLYSLVPYGDPEFTSNIEAVFKVYDIVTPQLTAATNTAVQNYCITYSPNFGTNVTKTFKWIRQTKTLSNIFAYANIEYTSTITGLPVSVNVARSIALQTSIWSRYDTTKPISSLSSYDYLTWPVTGAPYSWFDISGAFGISIPTLYPTSDGRYIYKTNPYFCKVDTQDFLNLSSYTFTTGGTPTVYPSYNPTTSDGVKLYLIAFSDGTNITFYRYNSTQSISSASSYDSINFPTTLWPSGYSFEAVGFDGRNIYYVGPSWDTANINLSIIRIDTVTYSIKDWIVFNYRSTTGRTSNGPINGLPLLTSKYYNTGGYFVAGLQMVTGTRYIYIGESRADYQTATDFLQIDPLTMTSSLSTSVIVKYEKYDKTPKTPLTLYGQTYLNEFTLHANRVSENFTLQFTNPIREIWIKTDVILKRIVVRLNNEIIVDDDQVTAQVIRPFETHTMMPTTNVYVLSVSLNPEILSEPSGTINASRIATPTLEIFPSVVQTTDSYLKVYAKVYNVFETYGGLGGLLFNSAY